MPLGELRVVRTERDLLKEQLNRSSASSSRQERGQRPAPEGHVLQRGREPRRAGRACSREAESAEDDKIDVPAHQRAKRGRKPLDPALPREVRRHELPEDERVCPHDGAALREIGVEVSEQLDIIPQQVRVIRHERVKYACPCCDGGLRLAAKPPQVIPKGLLSESGAGLGGHVEVPGRPAAVPPGRAAGRFGGTDCRATRWPPASCAWARRCSR
jgi:transposase